MKQPWIHSAGLDSAFILAPAFLSTFAVLLLRSGGWSLEFVSPFAWLFLIVGVDVAHVYSTLYRTYLDPKEFVRRRNLYLFAPLVGWVLGTLLYTMGALAFWRAMAYLAVFHFVRQQYGFAMIYSRGRATWLDRAVIYLATLYPLAFWHTHLPRDFHWFVDGDFVGLPGWVSIGVGCVYLAVLVAYVCREFKNWRRGRGFNLPRNLIVCGTAISWYVGIVWLDGDLAFTATNVVSHGIPYLALIWSYGRKAASREPARELLCGLPARILFSRWAVPFFVGSLVTLAFVEEGLWDALVWRDHTELFSGFALLPRVSDRSILSWLVPLLALPQITHYLLDGFLWRRGNRERNDEATSPDDVPDGALGRA